MSSGCSQVLIPGNFRRLTRAPNPELRIHEQTERGDNETVKQFKGTTKSFAEVKRCSLI